MTQSSQPIQETRPKVVAAIPCFNTESSIADVVRKTKKYVDEVIVIDDGSSDGTAEVAKAAGALIINHKTNSGYGNALKSCFGAAKVNSADVLVILDGDGQHNPDEIPLLLAPIFKGEADLVIGSRFLANEASMPRYRRFGISVITWLFNLGFRTNVSDAQSGFRAFTRKFFQNIDVTEKGMSASIETLEKARRQRVVFKEVPISCLYVASSLNLRAIRHGLGVALAVVRIHLKQLGMRGKDG